MNMNTYSKFSKAKPEPLPPSKGPSFGSRRNKADTPTFEYKRRRMEGDGVILTKPHENGEEKSRTPANYSSNYTYSDQKPHVRFHAKKDVTANTVNSLPLGAEVEILGAHFTNSSFLVNNNEQAPDFSGVFDAAELGGYLTNLSKNLTSHQEIEDFVNTMKIGQINLSNLTTWASNSPNPEEENSRFVTVGIVAKLKALEGGMKVSSGKVDKVAKMIGQCGGSTTDEAEAAKFAKTGAFLELQISFDAPRGSWEHYASSSSRLFNPGVLFREVLFAVQLRLAKEVPNFDKTAINQMHWERFVQTVFFAILKNKKDMLKLTYRLQKGKEGNELLNVYDSGHDDFRVVDALIAFMVSLVGKTSTREEALWTARAAATVTVALKKGRRRSDPAMKRRPRELLVPLSDYGRTLGWAVETEDVTVFEEVEEITVAVEEEVHEGGAAVSDEEWNA